MKPNINANPDSIEAGKSVRSPSTNNPRAKGVSSKSAKLNKSSTHVDVNVLEKKKAKLLKNVHKSPQNSSKVPTAAYEHMLSFTNTMKMQMNLQTEMWKFVKLSREELIESLEEIRAVFTRSLEALEKNIKILSPDLHDSDGVLAKSIATIKFDLRDPKGQLEMAFKESEERLLI